MIYLYLYFSITRNGDIDDVKKDLLTLSIEKLRPGMIVNIAEHDTQPMFACKQQLVMVEVRKPTA